MDRWDVLDAVVMSGRQCRDAPVATDADPFPVCSRHALTSTQRHVMHCLVRRADHKTAVIPRFRQPSLPELAADCRLARSTVQEAVKDLERLGWLVVEKPSRRAPAQYGFAIPSEPTGGPLSDPAPGPLADADEPDEPAVGPLSDPAPDASGPAVGPEWSDSRTTICSPVSKESPEGSSSSVAPAGGPDARPAYRVDCPWPPCQQPAGERCRSRTGTVLADPHDARFTAYAAEHRATHQAVS